MFISSLFLKHIRKYGSAFLNCDGGVLIAGILDNGNSVVNADVQKYW